MPAHQIRIVPVGAVPDRARRVEERDVAGASAACERVRDHGEEFARLALARDFSNVFFVDFGRRAARPLPATGGVLHVTVLREPIERCLSRFYYERDSCGLFPRDTTIDECINRKHPACRFDTWTAGDSVTSGRGWSRER